MRPIRFWIPTQPPVRWVFVRESDHSTAFGTDVAINILSVGLIGVLTNKAH